MIKSQTFLYESTPFLMIYPNIGLEHVKTDLEILN